MKKLHFYEADDTDELAWPLEPKGISLDSSAKEIFTDFNETPPLLLVSTTPAIEAEKLMQKSHVRLKLVVDEKSHFLGIVSVDDLNAQEFVKKLTMGFTKTDLTVSDFMRTRNNLKAFDYQELEEATIRDVIDSLKFSGYQHCLVLDRGTHKIRGIISASDIVRKLGLAIDLTRDSTFTGIFKALYT